ncbi:GNAT family N-acetyltransferase [Cohnella suwonensis]|uniref:GNAT family N-acetyltransferase n=1 Tax=Cohnella suwonensis TaxID=696072 RepID=A0ABW0M5J2_9BACL
MNSDRLIRTDYIQFRRTIIEDLDFVISTEQHPDNKPFIFSWTRDKHIETIKNEDNLHVIIEDKNKHKVGYIIISGLLNENKCIELTRITISEKGKGYGKESIKLIQDYIFTNLNAHRIWLDVKLNNNRAKHIYESAGFRVERIVRDIIKTEEEHESLIIMKILKEEYKR